MSRAISRRTALKRGVAAGTLVWIPPVVSSFRMPAMAQVGSPPPNPEPSPTPTTPAGETPTPTPTPTTPPTVGGTDTEVLGNDQLAETGRSMVGPAAAGTTLTAIGAGLRGLAERMGAEAPNDPGEG